MLIVYDEEKRDKKHLQTRFCKERRALREIGEDVEAKLREPNVDIEEYTFENHMFDERVAFFEDECDRSKKVNKRYDLMIMMQHDWPTVHIFSLFP